MTNQIIRRKKIEKKIKNIYIRLLN